MNNYNMKKLDRKNNRKQFMKKIKIMRSFPHVKLSGIILCIGFLSLSISYLLNRNDFVFASNIFANLFAGLITGVVICFISGFKQLSRIKIQTKRNWLNEMKELLYIYFSDYHKALRIKFDKFDGNVEIYDFYYDVHTHANDINTKILQSTFDERLQFKPIRYCKEILGYDAEAMKSDFEKLHSDIESIDINCPSSNEIIYYFKNIDTCLRKLNHEIYYEINKLDTEATYLDRTII